MDIEQDFAATGMMTMVQQKYQGVQNDDHVATLQRCLSRIGNAKFQDGSGEATLHGLMHHLDLSCLPSRAMLARLSHFCRKKNDRQVLWQLSSSSSHTDGKENQNIHLRR